MTISFFLFVPILILGFTTNIKCFSYDSEFIERKIISTTQDLDTSKVSTRWISQHVNHFNTSDLRSFKQKYLTNLEFYENGGPVYLFIGDEQEVYINYLLEGYIYDLATETSGALYNIEHRYYGQSNPLNMNGTDFVANLKYLNSRQALADIANLINKVVKKNHPNAKIIVIGGSYAGNLATWMTAIYPDLVYGAIASSAPILAKFDFYEFLETVTTDIKIHGGTACYDYIKNMFARYSDLLKTDEGIAIIQKQDHICSESDLKKPENQQFFMRLAKYRFGDLVQYAQNVGEIEEFCDNITSNQTQLADIYPVFKKPLQCNLDLQLKNLLTDRSSRTWRWLYQTCSEFSYSMTTTSSKQIFSSLVPESYISTLCTHLFGDEFTVSFIKEKVKQTNAYYKGLHPNVKNVVFYNGELDPWHRLSVLKDLSDSVLAAFVPKSSHAQDLNAALEDDPEELTTARIKIKNIIKKWIGFVGC